MLVLKNADFDGNIELVGSFIDLLHMRKRRGLVLKLYIQINFQSKSRFSALRLEVT